MEANPGTFEQQRFKEYRDNGINRLSIGVQSFNDKHLQTLGRVHGASEAIAACKTALNAGFENYNIDLMHGLPGQSADEAIADVRQAIELRPTHLSYYQLTLEPNTLFAANPPQLEVSAYARNNKRCQHNLNYWLFGDYLGIGAGAHSKLSFPAHNTIIRHSKARHPSDYIKADAKLEFMMNALRLNDGFSVQEFEGRTGETIASVRKLLGQAESDGLITRDMQQIKTTDLGSISRHTAATVYAQ